MAVKIEFINVLIPIKNIKRCKEFDSFEELLKIEKRWLDKTIWYDEYLYREGAMNVMDIEMIVKKWEKRGLNLFKYENGVKMWDELCVVDSFSGLTLSCDWIEVDFRKLQACYKE